MIKYKLITLNKGESEINWEMISLFRERFNELWSNLEDLQLGVITANFSNNRDGTYSAQTSLPNSYRLKGLYTDFRHFYLNSEPANIFKFIKYMTSLTNSSEFREFIKKEKRKFNATISILTWINIEGLPSNNKELLDLYFNAEIFHTDEGKKRRLVELKAKMNDELAKYILFDTVYTASLIIKNINWSLNELSRENLFLKVPVTRNKTEGIDSSL